MMKIRPLIMAVDDEPAILLLLKRTLESVSYDVIVATEGNSALTLLNKCHPDLVLLDIMMPDINGFEILESVRQNSNVPVIMLTAKDEISSVRSSLSLGADDYIRKPFSPKELLARIQAKLRRSGLTGQFD